MGLIFCSTNAIVLQLLILTLAQIFNTKAEQISTELYGADLLHVS